jgi:hypothetical protein
MRLTLGFSARLGAMMGAAHLAAAVLAAIALPAVAAVLAALALGLSGWDIWRRQVSRSAADAVVEVRLDGRCASLRRRDGRIDTGPIISRFANPALVLLTVRPEDRRRALPVVILPDAAGAEAHRRLRVWLKWGPDRADNPGSV